MRKMVEEQVEEQNDRDRDAFKALLLRLHAPVKPQPTPEHDYYDCCLPDCQRCSDYKDGYLDATLDAREWKLGDCARDCVCTPCATVREVIRSFLGMLRSPH